MSLSRGGILGKIRSADGFSGTKAYGMDAGFEDGYQTRAREDRGRNDMPDRGRGRGDSGSHLASVLILMGVLILLKAMTLAAAGGKSLLRFDVDGVLRLMGSEC